MCALNYPQAICALSPLFLSLTFKVNVGEYLVSFDGEALVDAEKDYSYFRGVSIPV